MTARRMLRPEEAQRVYDRIGSWQDSQDFYEGPARERLCDHLDLGHARAIVEFGCGTGRLAEAILDRRAPAQARYLGLDVSGTMVRLAAARLARFGSRAAVRRTDGAPRIDAPDASFDRGLATWVLDLLTPEDADALLRELHRVLRPGGLLGVASLTPGERGAARLVTACWDRIHRLRPAWVGGCRPVRVAPRLAPERWALRHHGVVTAWAVPSEVVVAARRPDPGASAGTPAPPPERSRGGS
ncbi:MAG: class I SAM-dependent methyltransferase [Myxococcota bacterium]|nr:class I SAM-dependent methyltransferase [Myxococcota bacterium]